MTSLEIRLLGLAALVLSFVLALAVVGAAAGLGSLIRRLRAEHTRPSVPTAEAECHTLKEAA